MKLKKITLILMLGIAPSFLFAADDGQEVADNIRETLINIINIVGLLAMIIVIAFKGGLSYMLKDKDDRSSEDGNQLKNLAFKVVIGGGLMLGATNLAGWIWGMLGGN